MEYTGQCHESFRFLPFLARPVRDAGILPLAGRLHRRRNRDQGMGRQEPRGSAEGLSRPCRRPGIPVSPLPILPSRAGFDVLPPGDDLRERQVAGTRDAGNPSRDGGAGAGIHDHFPRVPFPGTHPDLEAFVRVGKAGDSRRQGRLPGGPGDPDGDGILAGRPRRFRRGGRRFPDLLHHREKRGGVRVLLARYDPHGGGTASPRSPTRSPTSSGAGTRCCSRRTCSGRSCSSTPSS